MKILKNTSGYTKNVHGYLYIYRPKHPFADKMGFIPQHRSVIEESKKISLHPWIKIHHKNKKRNDNRLENLEIVTPNEHARLHNIERWKNNRSILRPCRQCGTNILVIPFYIRNGGRYFCSAKCYGLSRRKPLNTCFCGRNTKRKFCSWKCAFPNSKVNVRCKTCNKKFPIFSCRLKRGQGKFCSRRCIRRTK